ncbi:MAG: extracellular solute-binding protein [Christensenellales bacterium]|jgi:putative aldouronate transport system substrate-binding protein
MKKTLVFFLVLALMLTGICAIPTVSAEEDITLSISVTWNNENAFSSAIFDEMAEALGITFDIRLIEGDVKAEKYATMFLSNDYPEVLTNPSFSNADLINYGSEEGYLIPLNDYIRDDLTPNICALLAEHDGWQAMMTMPDGNIYGIPATDSGGGGHGDVSYKMWINTAWLDAVDKEMPTTIDELCDVIRAFKTDDPNGNGQADEIGLTGATGTWAADTWLNLLNAFGYFHEYYYYVKDGTVYPILNQDYLREGLSYMAAMYDEGLIDPGSFTQDLDSLGTIGNAETLISGLVTCGHIGMYLDVNNYDNFKNWINILPLEGPNGYKAIPYQTSSTVSGGNFCVTDVCAHPEVAMQFADMVCDEAWNVRHQVGIKGVDWDVADEGTFGMDGVSPAKYKYLTYTVSASNAENNKWGHTLRLLEYNWKNMFQVVGDMYDSANYEAFLYQNTVKLRPYAADVDMIAPLMFENVDDATDFATISANVGSYAKNSIVEFITGVRDIDDDGAWDAYLKDLEGYQYNEMLELIQKTIEYMGY